MKCPYCNSTLLKSGSDDRSNFCKNCDKVIDFEDGEIECASCQQVVVIDSEDMCNDHCLLCGEGAC